MWAIDSDKYDKLIIGGRERLWEWMKEKEHTHKHTYKRARAALRSTVSKLALDILALSADCQV